MTTGWRCWEVTEKYLASPLAGVVLAADGLAVADPPPRLGDEAGIHYYPHQADALRMMNYIESVAVTVGHITGPTYPDWRKGLYMTADGVPVVQPAGRRCARYQVTHIYTDAALTHDYGVTVHPLKDLADAR